MDMRNEPEQSLLRCISKDCGHILEAIRRLRDGTWHLNDEDADWANFLFPQIHRALQDHIEYETLCVFPELSEDLVKEHVAEHEQIMALLWAVDQSKQMKESDRFHSLLDLLVNVLDQHHKECGCAHPRLNPYDEDCATTRIIRRAQGSMLETI